MHEGSSEAVPPGEGPPAPAPAPKGLEHLRRPHEMREVAPGRLQAVYLIPTGKTKTVPDPDHPGQTKQLRGLRQAVTEFNLDRLARKQACRDLGISGKKLRKLLKAEKRNRKMQADLEEGL